MGFKTIRRDFPVLERKLNGKNIVYFDNACMSLKPAKVIEKLREYYEEYTGCAGRSVHRFSERVTQEMEETRDFVRGFLEAKSSKEIVFTKNTTEAINLVAYSLDLKKGDLVLTTDREHNSNLIPWILMEEKRGIKHEVVTENKNGEFDLLGFEEKLRREREGVKLVAFPWVSNLDGYELPVKKIVKIARDYNSLVLIDAAQRAGHGEINLRKTRADFLAFSGHKALGPTGTGVLYVREENYEKMTSFIVGGETIEESFYDKFVFLEEPYKFEAGLQNYAGIIALKEALKYLKKIGLENIENHEKKLVSFLEKEVENIMGLESLTKIDKTKRAGIFSFNMEAIPANDLATILDMENIMLRSGKFCVNSWFNAYKKKDAVRASFHVYNTKEEIKKLVEMLRKIERDFGESR